MKPLRRQVEMAHRGVYSCLLLVGLLPLCVAAPISQVFAFGDHFLDVGASSYFKKAIMKANFGPYSQTFKPRSGRFSNGQLTIDFIMSRLGKSYLEPYLSPNATKRQGTSFAIAGAGALASTYATRTISLPAQVKLFRTYSKKRANDPALPLNRSLIVLSAGTYDYIQLIQENSKPAVLSIVNNVTDGIVKAIKQIYAITGTSKFVIYDIPTLGCLPHYRRMNKTYGCNPVAKLVGDVHNAVLRRKMAALRARIPNLILLRLSGIFDDFVYNASTAEFTQIAAPCCQTLVPSHNAFVGCGQTKRIGFKVYTGIPCTNPSKFAFWDGLNPTETVNQRAVFILWNTVGLYTFNSSLSAIVNL